MTLRPEEKPFAPACERNREPIFEALNPRLTGPRKVLEIGSGTGQHAAYFLQHREDWDWQCSDLPERLEDIEAWLADAPRQRRHPPLALDLLTPQWPEEKFDAIYTANTLHIMPWQAVENLFLALPELLRPEGRFFSYGPFRDHGHYNSPSNAEFDHWLWSQHPQQGLRDIQDLKHLAGSVGFELREDLPMPANNQLLIWSR